MYVRRCGSGCCESWKKTREYSEAAAQVKAQVGGVSTYPAEGVGPKETGKVLDYFTVREPSDNRIDKVEVVEEYGLNQHKLTRCEIRLVRVNKWNKDSE